MVKGYIDYPALRCVCAHAASLPACKLTLGGAQHNWHKLVQLFALVGVPLQVFLPQSYACALQPALRRSDEEVKKLEAGSSA